MEHTKNTGYNLSAIGFSSFLEKSWQKGKAAKRKCGQKGL